MAKDPKNSTQEHLSLAEIRDGIIILKDGGLRIALLAESINFSLKSEKEQNAITYGYQNFLNSLNFNIQILMQSRKLELEKYLLKLEVRLKEETNELLQIQINDYIAFIRKMISVANIMAKKFYIIIPYNPPKVQSRSFFDKLLNSSRYSGPTFSETEFKKYKEEIIQRANVIASGLGTLGVKVKLLNTQQIIELMYISYNLEEAETEQLTEVESLSQSIITKNNNIIK